MKDQAHLECASLFTHGIYLHVHVIYTYIYIYLYIYIYTLYTVVYPQYGYSTREHGDGVDSGVANFQTKLCEQHVIYTTYCFGNVKARGSGCEFDSLTNDKMF